jgi:hypothetical protein
MLKKIVLTLMIVSAGGQLSLIACEKKETKVRGDVMHCYSQLSVKL